MTAYSRGDVVLVGFVFSDESGKKFLFGDHVIADWKGAGLLFPSSVTGILRTIKRTMIDRKLGAMPKTDMEAVHRELRRSLGL